MALGGRHVVREGRVADGVGARGLKVGVRVGRVVAVVHAVQRDLGVDAQVGARVQAAAVLGRAVVLRDGEQVRRDRAHVVGVHVVGHVLAHEDDDVAVAHGAAEDDKSVVRVVDDLVDG